MTAATRAVFLLIAMTLFAAGCSTKAPKQTNFMEQLGVEDVTTRELQLVVYGFGLRWRRLNLPMTLFSDKGA